MSVSQGGAGKIVLCLAFQEDDCANFGRREFRTVFQRDVDVVSRFETTL